MSQSAVGMPHTPLPGGSSGTRITKDQSKDTGMAMVLLLLILYVKFRRESLLFGALGLQILVMTAPGLFSRVAVVWLGLTNAIGGVMSRVLLAIVFFLVVTPIGVVRRLLGKDPMRLRTFKQGHASAMLTRNHTFAAADIEKPY